MFYHAFIGRRKLGKDRWDNTILVYPHCRSVSQDNEIIKLTKQNGGVVIFPNKYYFLAKVEVAEPDNVWLDLDSYLVKVKEWAEDD